MSDCPYCGRRLNGGRGPFRVRDGRKVLGVCAGIADHFGWPRFWVRVAAVVALIAGILPTLLVYFVAAALMDSEERTEHVSPEAGSYR